MENSLGLPDKYPPLNKELLNCEKATSQTHTSIIKNAYWPQLYESLWLNAGHRNRLGITPCSVVGETSASRILNTRQLRPATRPDILIASFTGANACSGAFAHHQNTRVAIQKRAYAPILIFSTRTDATYQGRRSRSTFPPDRMTPTRFPATSIW